MSPLPARSIPGALAGLVLVVAAPAEAWASAGSMLERPTFERESNAVVVPFQGPVPRVEVSSQEGATLLTADFLGSQTREAETYKLGVFHPLVTKVAMQPLPNQARVRVHLSLASPAHVTAVPDVRRGVVRLHVMAGEAPPPGRAPAPQPAPPVAALPGGGPDWPPDSAHPGHVALTAPPPAFTPYAPPSPGPVRFGGTTPMPGTPASGEYVYRKAIASDDGKDVTEVQIRTPRRSDVEVHREAPSAAVSVSVAGPEAIPPALTAPPNVPLASAASTADEPAPAREGWVKPLPNEPWKLPVYRGDLFYRPVPAVDAVVGFAAFSEQAPTLGSTSTGNGSTLLGLSGHVPLGNAWNLNATAETTGYAVSHLQVPDLTTRRDEVQGGLSIEHLAIRRPWVLAVGGGYWGRFTAQRSNLIGPVTPSVMFTNNLLFHGPILQARTWLPVWEALGVHAEAQAAPFLFGGGDEVAAAIGGAWSYQATAALRWGQRRWALGLGFRQVGVNSFNGVYGFTRSGPEVVGTWRF